MKKQEVFCHIFVIGIISFGVGPGLLPPPPPPPPRATSMIVTSMLFVVLRFLYVFLLVCPDVHVRATLMV